MTMKVICLWWMFHVRESEKEAWYYSTKAHVEELMECLDGGQWEKELLMALQEMKDDILKQVSITEDLTASNKGGKKSIMEIETGRAILSVAF